MTASIVLFAPVDGLQMARVTMNADAAKYQEIKYPKKYQQIAATFATSAGAQGVAYISHLGPDDAAQTVATDSIVWAGSSFAIPPTGNPGQVYADTDYHSIFVTGLASGFCYLTMSLQPAPVRS